MRFIRIVMPLLACVFVTHCFGQVQSQRFTVRVPENVGTTSPADAVLDFDESAESQVFPNQKWNVRGNVAGGVTVQFAVSNAFTHQSLSDIKANVGLNISVDSSEGAANWQVTQASDTSSVANNDNEAVVQVTSDGVGTAQIGLSLRFIPSSIDALPMGDYSAEVVCTVMVP